MRKGGYMKTFRITIIFAIASIFCLISFISLSWSAEKTKTPSSAVGTTIMPQPTPGMIPAKPFTIKVGDVTKTYLPEHAFDLCAALFPRDDTQTAIDATIGKQVAFLVNNDLLGNVKTGNTGRACLSIAPHTAARFQAGAHEIIAQAGYGSSVIKGYGKLVITKADSRIDFKGFMPEKQTYKLGETVTFRGILKHRIKWSDDGRAIANATVECTVLYYTSEYGLGTSSANKSLFTVQTNNQGGFECPVNLAPGVFDTVFKTQKCRLEYLGAYFSGNQNFNYSAERSTIRVCP